MNKYPCVIIILLSFHFSMSQLQSQSWKWCMSHSALSRASCIHKTANLSVGSKQPEPKSEVCPHWCRETFKEDFECSSWTVAMWQQKSNRGQPMSIILPGRSWWSSSSPKEGLCHVHTIHKTQKKGQAKEEGLLRRSGQGLQKPEEQPVESHKANSGPSTKSDGWRTRK